MDMKKLLSIVDHSGVQQKAVITESVSAPAVSKTEQYFKAVNNEVLQNINEQHAQKKIEVKRIVSRVLDKLDEGKTTKDKPAVRNFVAKNSPKSGAGAHEDKKRAAKQGDVKHKKQAVPVDENLSPPDGATAPPPKGKDGQYPIVTSGPHKGKRWSPQTPGPTNPAFKEGVAGPQHCWPGHRKVGTQPGTGKNAGKRVNDCEKIKKESVKPKTTPVNEGDE